MRLREDQWIPVGVPWGPGYFLPRGAPQSLGTFKLLPKSVERKVKTAFFAEKIPRRTSLFFTSSFQSKCHPVLIPTRFAL